MAQINFLTIAKTIFMQERPTTFLCAVNLREWVHVPKANTMNKLQSGAPRRVPTLIALGEGRPAFSPLHFDPLHAPSTNT